MTKTLTAFATVFMLFASNAGTLQAANPDGPIPGLPWVHEGTVFISRFYAAKVFDRGITFTQNLDGEWIGSDGKTYSGEVHQAIDAGGFAETTVLAIDGDKVVLKKTSFLQVGVGDPTRSSPQGGGEPRFIASALRNDYYEAPQLLAKEVSDSGQGILVRQISFAFNGKQIDATRIDRTTKSEVFTVVIERHTGLVLHLSSVSSTGADTGTVIMSYDLVDCHDLQIPWAHEPVPQGIKSMHLAGHVQQDAQYGLAPSGVALDLTLDRNTDKWALFKVVGTSMVPGVGPQSSPAVPTIYSSAEFGGLWIGPVAAAGLCQGQVLDSDPFSKTTTVVSAVNGRTISITQSNQKTMQEYVYDRTTGLLVGSQWFDAVSKFRTILQNAQ